MNTTDLKRRALATAGTVARHVPNDNAQLFAFISSPAVRAEPWALYQRLHRRGPIRPGPYGTWLVASHSAVTTLLRHSAVSVDETKANLPGSTSARDGAFTKLIDRTLLFTDPPDHARLRRLVSRDFTPRVVADLHAPIESLVDQMLQEVEHAGSGDLIESFAIPFPVAVICELLGIDQAERPRFLSWARHLAPRLDIDIFRDAETERQGDLAAANLVEFLDELIDQPHRRHPDGLLTTLVEREDKDELLQRDEVIALVVLLLVAGFETTSNLIANSIPVLLDHPDQLAALRDGGIDPAAAIEELLRYAGPVQFSQRVLLEDIDIDGHPIPAGTLAALLIGAANRDPDVFDQPDTLDLTRDPNPHLAFSSGIHHCLGASLARVEAQIAIPAILRTLPNLELDGTPTQRDTFVLRGLTTLPLRWSSARR